MITVFIFTLLSTLLSVPASNGTTRAKEFEPQSVVRVDKSTRRGWIGVSIQDLTPKLAKANGNKVTEGALVNEVERKSPADSAGLEEGDVIVEFDGRKIYDADGLSKSAGRAKPGTTVSVVIDRKGMTKTLKLTVGKNPSRISRAFSFNLPGPHVLTFGKSKAIGADLRPLNEQLAEYFQVPDGKGVLVESVEKGSAADKAGMKAGDILVNIGTERVRELSDLWEALADYDEGDKAEVEVIRKGASKKLTVEIEEGDEGNWYQFRTQPRLRWFNDLDRWIKLELEDLPRIEIEKIQPKLEELREMHIERIRPDLDMLRLDMDRLRDELRLKNRRLEEIPKPDIRSRIEKDLRYKI